jgi:5'-deoxynucleotidase YfbR-like HD superfamily hydrolase
MILSGVLQMSYYITHYGRKIDIEDISAGDICLSDIAHHLTKICRYGGAMHLDEHYSVAQHSIQLANYAKGVGHNVDVQRALLMHDATEAYLGDVVSGLKAHLPDYKTIEFELDYTIHKKYGLVTNLPIRHTVKHLDTAILLDEALAFTPHRYNLFKAQLQDIEPLGIMLFPEKNLYETYYLFLHWCNKLNIRD